MMFGPSFVLFRSIADPKTQMVQGACEQATTSSKTALRDRCKIAEKGEWQ